MGEEVHDLVDEIVNTPDDSDDALTGEDLISHSRSLFRGLKRVGCDRMITSDKLSNLVTSIIDHLKW